MNIELVLAAPPLLLESDQCRRLGMIVSELITNAARHAFVGRPGRIRVELLRAGALVKCIVSDNGSAAARIRDTGSEQWRRRLKHSSAALSAGLKAPDCCAFGLPVQ